MTWYINVYAPANASIIKDTQYTGVLLPDGTTAAPSETTAYEVSKGSSITLYATIRNTGDKQASMWIAWYDEYTGKILASKIDSVAGGDTTSLSKAITVNSSLKLMVRAGLGTTVGQNQTDYWGCGEENTLPP